MNHGWRLGNGGLQQGDSKPPRALQGPTRYTHRLAGTLTQSSKGQTGQRASRTPS